MVVIHLAHIGDWCSPTVQTQIARHFGELSKYFAQEESEAEVQYMDAKSMHFDTLVL